MPLIYITSTNLVGIALIQLCFYAIRARSLMILIIEFIYAFQYGTMHNKKCFSNMNLLNNVLSVVVVLFL